MKRHEAKALGLKHYTTEKPCRRGHLAKRFTCSGVCIECCRMDYYSHRDDRLKRVKDRYAANPQNAWGNRNPEKKNASTARWKKKGDNAQAWRKKYPDKSRSHVRNRRAKRKGNGGTHTAKDIAEIHKSQRNRCAYCRISFVGRDSHVDHIVPIVRGGSNHRSNLQILCAPCNRSKGSKDPLDFMRLGGFLL
jgi:5-methylcytosine-specific restriction endonuclease McrA